MNNFPLIDANILLPDGVNGLSEKGVIGITTNTTSPGEVLTNIPPALREKISVMGSLITNRDGAERVILNSLAHPSLVYLILFGEETGAFRPSTNLLKAIMHGYKEGSGNLINNSVAIGANYPNINEKVLEAFRNNIVLLPIFKSPDQKAADQVVLDYIEYIKPRIPEAVYNFLIDTNNSGKIFYDKLVKLIELVPITNQEKVKYVLDAKDFSSLQPPKIYLKPSNFELPKFDLEFQVKLKDGAIELVFKHGNKVYGIIGNSAWQIAKTFANFIFTNNIKIPEIQQFLIGVELSRIELEIVSDIQTKSMIQTQLAETGNIEYLELEENNSFQEDKEYYYKIFVRDKEAKVSIQCLAYDKCADVFELLSDRIEDVLSELTKLNRYGNFDGAILHRMDTGIELLKAFAAKENKGIYIQDGKGILKINETDTVLALGDAGDFLGVHKALVTRTLGEGLQEMHADVIKGICRATTALGIYRGVKSLDKMPAFYQMGSQTTEEIRAAYKEQLLRFDNDGSYSYGQRTRAHFGFDQLTNAIKNIREKGYFIIQRFDPTVDMGFVMKDGKEKSTKDPCLTHDIYFMQNGKLQCFHIARAHNLVNAYPENIFGLHDAYDTFIAKELGVEIGDTYMLSSRANILLLNEEMKAKAIMNEPSKPYEEKDKASGPYKLNSNQNIEKGVYYEEGRIQETTGIENNEILNAIIDYNGVDEIDKVITYFKKKGPKHNNPILTDYYATKEFNYISGMPFLQINAVGGKIYAVGVFLNRKDVEIQKDKALVQFIATKIAKELSLQLGKYLIFNIK